jgi:hypothetical protein
MEIKSPLFRDRDPIVSPPPLLALWSRGVKDGGKVLTNTCHLLSHLSVCKTFSISLPAIHSPTNLNHEDKDTSNNPKISIPLLYLTIDLFSTRGTPRKPESPTSVHVANLWIPFPVLLIMYSTRQSQSLLHASQNKRHADPVNSRLGLADSFACKRCVSAVKRVAMQEVVVVHLVHATHNRCFSLHYH